MALTYEWRTIENFAEVFPFTESGEIHPDIKVAVFGSMAVGINEITPDNAFEFHKRLSLWYTGPGPLFNNWPEDSDEPVPYLPPLHRIKLMVGLTTNATIKTRRQFFRDLESATDWSE